MSYYSIYPKLRAIYSFLPTEKEMESLLESKGLSGFNRRIQEGSKGSRITCGNSENHKRI